MASEKRDHDREAVVERLRGECERLNRKATSEELVLYPTMRTKLKRHAYLYMRAANLLELDAKEPRP